MTTTDSVELERQPAATSSASDCVEPERESVAITSASGSHDIRSRRRQRLQDADGERQLSDEQAGDKISSPVLEGESAGEGTSAPSASDDVGDRARGTRIDTTFLSSADREQLQKRAEDKIASLSSISASERKLSTLPITHDDAGPSASASTYTVVDLAAINRLLQRTRCRTCGGDVSITKGEREYGIAVKLCLQCSNCGIVDKEWTSPRAPGTAKCRPFKINLLASRALQSTGNGQTALNDVFSAMGVSHRGLHHKTYQSHLKDKFMPAATKAAEKVLSNCALTVKNLYSELRFGHAGNIAVCFDGTWMTRGHLSHIGVGTVIELFSGYVLDYIVLSNFCAGCKNAPPEEDPQYAIWKANHICQKNTESKSGHMEVEAAVTLFERSILRHGLRYTTMLCDGDSRSFRAIVEASVYGFIPVTKEDCINHVQKRMGTALRNLVHKHSGETLSGKGRLTGDLIVKLTNYYGWALKSNVGNVEQMQQAVMATFHHITSTDERPNHSLCPSGSDSWCKYNAAVARDEPPPRHRYNLPDHVSQALQPVYERLSDKELLERCHRGKTQNANEAFHSVVWSLMPKDKHASLIAVQTAVAEAVIRFNSGSTAASALILRELQVDENCKSSRRNLEKDSRRAKKSEKQRAASVTSLQAAKRGRHAQASTADYCPGAF